ncbi:hypothetical protein HRI_003897900 [Hibiscus trionum]|uniref:UDP-glucose 4-epimerase n=1 Tax=Hibiscus trionum TaxID=183268 RepID=A0A9W7ITZ4_HIBTR|nr:hypothetical protein HRI_003897900 [Hibiscus trionum]
MSKNILVTGGASYIGSHTVLQLLLGGYKVVVSDNLDNSSAVAIKRVEELAGESGRNLSFRQVDLRDRSALEKFFSEIKYCKESICSFLCLFLWLLMDVKILCFHHLLLFMVGRRRFHVQKSPPGCSESIWTNKGETSCLHQNTLSQ